MNAKHTPTPIELRGPINIGFGCSRFDLWDSNNECFAQVASEKWAKHIVRCVNAHNELVAALERLSEIFDRPEHDPDRAHDEACAMRDARAILATVQS